MTTLERESWYYILNIVYWERSLRSPRVIERTLHILIYNIELLKARNTPQAAKIYSPKPSAVAPFNCAAIWHSYIIMLLRTVGWNSASPLNVRNYLREKSIRKVWRGLKRLQSTGGKGLIKKEQHVKNKSRCNRKRVLICCYIYFPAVLTDCLTGIETKRVGQDNAFQWLFAGCWKIHSQIGIVPSHGVAPIFQLLSTVVSLNTRQHAKTAGEKVRGSGFLIITRLSRRCVSSEKGSDCWASRQQVLIYST